MVALLGITGLALLVAAAAAAFIGDVDSLWSLTIAGLTTIIIAAMVGIATQGRKREAGRAVQLAVIIGAFALLPLFAALPLYLQLPDMNLGRAYFEILSAMTTTGLTALDPEQALPAGLALWRGMVAWLGGFLTIVAGIAIFAPLRLGGFEVTVQATEGRAGRHPMAARLSPAALFGRWALDLAPIYLCLSLLLLIALEASGASGLDAVLLTLAVMSTSGLVGQDVMAGIGFAGEAIVLLFTVLAFSYHLLHRPQTALGFVRKDGEMRLALTVALGLSTALMLGLWMSGQPTGLAEIWTILATVTSFLATNGLEMAGWADLSEGGNAPGGGLVLLIAAMIGGGIATTAGGLKLIRIVALSRHANREMERLVHPSSVGGASGSGRHVRREGAYIAWMFVMIFFLAVAVGGMGLSFFGLEFEAAVVLALSALTNCGPLASSVVSPAVNLADEPSAVRWVLSMLMLVGRIEALAVVALFNAEFWRR